MHTKKDNNQAKRLVSPRVPRIFVGLLLVSMVIGYAIYGVCQLYFDAVGFTLPDNLTLEQERQLQALSLGYADPVDQETILELQQKIYTLPWVDSVRIRRQISSYHIDTQFFTPVAVLNDRWFLSSRGKTKDFIDDTGYTDLIRYRFNPEQQHIFFPQAEQLKQQLETLGFRINQLKVTPAGNWSVTTTVGLELHFGVNHFNKKVMRLKKQLPNIRTHGDPVRIDLRNKQGVAVQY